MAPAASPSNPYKRQIDAVQRVYDCAKRPKPNNSAVSTVATDPRPLPTSAPGDAADASRPDSDDESRLSESSEEPSEESSEEDSEEAEDDVKRGDELDEQDVQGAEAIVNLRANRGKRPDYALPTDEELEDIRPFLKDFLPKLKAANEELEAQKRAGTLQSSEMISDEDVDGEQQYIEMNLGLGVLEEKDDDADQGTHRAWDDGTESDKEEQAHGEKNILGKLMARDKLKEPVGIQEVTHR